MSLAGIYIHIPFCVRKCAYCDFYSIADLGLRPAFLDALRAEIAAAESDLTFDTIYFGGGTPSLLAPRDVSGIIEWVRTRFRSEPDVEITLESNPGTLSLDTLRGFRAAGVNRLTLGVQSFDAANLEMLGRIHTSAQAEGAIQDARAAGFEEIDIDLIYGLPGQALPEWRADLERALAYDPEHLSCYMLIMEPGTPMARRRDSGGLSPAAEEVVAEMFTLTSELLSASGYRHYEIANFARCVHDSPDAHISRHNSKYWAYAPYLGFGPAAHSFLPPRRFWNERNLPLYLDAIGAGKGPPGGEEVLTAEQQMSEVVMLGLRTSAGVDLADFERRFGRAAATALAQAAEAFVSQGLVARDGSRIGPTRTGMLYHNQVVGQMVEQVEEAVPKVS